MGGGTVLEMSPILKLLELYRRSLVVVSGPAVKQAEAMGDGTVITREHRDG